MGKYYIWNISDTDTVFSSIACNKNIDFSAQTSDSENTIAVLTKDDFVLGIKNDSEIFVILKVIDSKSNKVTFSKIFETAKVVDAKKYNLAVPSDSLQEIDEFLYATIENVLKDSGSHILTKVNSQKNIPFSHNRIIFGAPGTGKSHQLETDKNDSFSDDCYERVTFHPNYSYAHFVGSYKPKMKNKLSNPSEKEIVYEFVPGPFLRIYEKAKKEPGKSFLLLIEEINRANVAAVFGDVFQLLDRFGKSGDKNGKNAFCSEYPIDLPEDIKQRFADDEKLKNETKLSLPSNMYIWATMNSADQGVFPMDTAFKRRWEFEYIGINKNSDKLVYEDGKKILVPIPKGNAPESSESEKLKYTLVEGDKLRREINNKLSAIQSVNEDKWLGPFFIGLEKLRSAKVEPQNFIKLFKSKVLMYLYEDVVKINPTKLFVGCGDHPKYSTICEKFNEIGCGIFDLELEKQNPSETESSETANE